MRWYRSAPLPPFWGWLEKIEHPHPKPQTQIMHPETPKPSTPSLEPHTPASRKGALVRPNEWEPFGGVRGFWTPSISGCYVTNFAPHLALKLIAPGKLTFGERFELHRVGGRVFAKRCPVSLCLCRTLSHALAHSLSHILSGVAFAARCFLKVGG